MPEAARCRSRVVEGPAAIGEIGEQCCRSQAASFGEVGGNICLEQRTVDNRVHGDSSATGDQESAKRTGNSSQQTSDLICWLGRRRASHDQIEAAAREARTKPCPPYP